MKKNNIQPLLNNIYHTDALKFMKSIPDNSIDLILTDPPYFLDKLDNEWNHQKVSENKDYCKVVKSLPAGMKFDKEQGVRFYNWYIQIASEMFRILKPGAFLFSFSSPRLFHRMACAIDDAGFLLRDTLLWIYTQNQPKAMSLNHFIEKSKMSQQEKENLTQLLNGWKTPQLKSCYEPIAMAQKPTEGTFLENFQKYKVGLINTNILTGIHQNMFPSNVLTHDIILNEMDKYFLVSKPTKKEKGEFNTHKTVKPLSICEHLIKLTTFDNSAIVFDPFAGSGTTLVAAKKLNRNYLGCDINEEYINIAKKRLSELDEKNTHSKMSANLFS
jgi:site-specific DNA-methyltransferase (adenine-specific)